MAGKFQADWVAADNLTGCQFYGFFDPYVLKQNFSGLQPGIGLCFTFPQEEVDANQDLQQSFSSLSDLVSQIWSGALGQSFTLQVTQLTLNGTPVTLTNALSISATQNGVRPTSAAVDFTTPGGQEVLRALLNTPAGQPVSISATFAGGMSLNMPVHVVVDGYRHVHRHVQAHAAREGRGDRHGLTGGRVEQRPEDFLAARRREVDRRRGGTDAVLRRADAERVGQRDGRSVQSQLCHLQREALPQRARPDLGHQVAQTGEALLEVLVRIDFLLREGEAQPDPRLQPAEVLLQDVRVEEAVELAARQVVGSDPVGLELAGHRERGRCRAP